MRNKLIATSAGLFGYGLLWGWAITGDRMERKMKSNQQLLGDIIDRKSRELNAAKALLLNDPRIPMPDDVEEEVGLNNVDNEADVIFPEKVVETAIDAVHRHDDKDTFRHAQEDLAQAEHEEVPTGETPEETRRHLQGLIDEYTVSKEELHDFDNLVLAHDEVELIPPFVISRTKFSWDEEEGNDYEKTTLNYYPREGVLIDEDQDIIEDLTATVGMGSLSRFGDESEDADIVFVRNRRLQTDFEVVRLTEEQPPAHIRYGMERDVFEVNKAAGLMRLRPGDE